MKTFLISNKIHKIIVEVFYEFDLPSSSGSASMSCSGVSIASANPELLSLGSPSSWLSSSCLSSFWSLAAWMTTSGIWFGSLGSVKSLFVV